MLPKSAFNHLPTFAVFFFGLFNIPAFDSLPVSCKGETINWFPKAGGAERLMTGGQASVVGGVVGTC